MSRTETEAREPEQIFSPRLVSLLDQIRQGRTPNAGRFCAWCYHPLSPERRECPHCGLPLRESPPVSRIPAEVIAMHKARRLRESLVVWSIAWGGLVIGICLSVIPLALTGGSWWSVVTFFAIIGFFYLLSMFLANTVGDATGYRWGRSLLEKRWRDFQAQREGVAAPAEKVQ